MRILMATDGSTNADEALNFGAQIARRTDENPTILAVTKIEADRSHVDVILACTQRFLSMQDTNVQTKVRIGYPAEEIIREAEEGAYDLVIVGEGQHHALVTRFKLGSTALRVAENSPCPVIIVKGKARSIHRILLCDSGAGRSSLLSRFTLQLAEMLEGQEEITVLHVMSQISAGPGVRGEHLRANAEALIEVYAPEGNLLKQDIQVLRESEIHSTPKVRHGLVLDEILDESKKGNYDLVIIGAHQGEGWQRLLLEDQARKIMSQLHRPVLVVK
ncbi:MAG: universal stress protein [Anaerolineales bacterium]|nr:universal stress protein [Anaerolineales bacterium]